MKRRVCAVVIALFCFVLLVFSGVPAKAEVIHETDLEEYILKEMTEAHVMTMGISIVSPEREAYCAVYGSETKTDGDYVLGELTQSFTAAAILHLFEDSEIGLDDTVGRYLSDPAYKVVQDVTIRELLSQTSGISKYETMSDITRSGVTGAFEDAPVNYNLLGQIIEAVSGESYEEYVADNILDPLEMDSTHTFRNNNEFLDDMVPGYRYYYGFPFEKENQYDAKDDWLQVGAGLMISDVKDLGKYLQMYLQNGGDVLPEDMITSMLDGKINTASDAKFGSHIFEGESYYGMGWLSTKVDGSQVYYYTGKSENSTTGMFLLPEQKLGIVLLFNTADSFKGQELIEKLEAGIISIELEKQAETFQSENDLTQYIIMDVAMILLILAAWMPIFMMGFWISRRRNHVGSVIGILIDLCIHIALPTVLLVLVQEKIPLAFFYRLYPDIFYVFAAILGTLYLGAVIKLIAMIVFIILGPKEETDADKETDEEDEPEDDRIVAADTLGKASAEKVTVKKTEETKASAEENVVKKSEEKNDSGEKTIVKKPEEKKDSGEKNIVKKAEEKNDPAEKSTGKKVDKKKASAEKTVVKEADVKKVPAEETAVKKADAKKAPVTKADVKEVPVKKADVKEAHKENADVKNADAKKAETKEADVKKAEAAKADVKQADVKEVEPRHVERKRKKNRTKANGNGKKNHKK